MAVEYPRYCALCGKVDVYQDTVEYSLPQRDGKLIYIKDMVIDKCNTCGEIWFTPETDACIEEAKK